MDKLVSNPEEWRCMVRVYAIIINEQREVLLSDELFKNTYMTKFPGGGLEYGEGTIDCLKREAIEEFGQEIDVIRHFYTTDFFQASLFHEKTQLISIYYLARFSDPIRFVIADNAFAFTSNENGSISFRWKAIAGLNENDVSFPIDKYVVNLIKSSDNL
ncbi:MAG TPA: NUDIX domain-containing protein [Bacteroidales bacterium]|nr:NUDIX domain-containing protein [Bacteroidales bacterium]